MAFDSVNRVAALFRGVGNPSSVVGSTGSGAVSKDVVASMVALVPTVRDEFCLGRFDFVKTGSNGGTGVPLQQVEPVAEVGEDGEITERIVSDKSSSSLRGTPAKSGSNAQEMQVAQGLNPRTVQNSRLATSGSSGTDSGSGTSVRREVLGDVVPRGGSFGKIGEIITGLVSVIKDRGPELQSQGAVDILPQQVVASSEENVDAQAAKVAVRGKTRASWKNILFSGRERLAASGVRGSVFFGKQPVFDKNVARMCYQAWRCFFGDAKFAAAAAAFLPDEGMMHLLQPSLPEILNLKGSITPSRFSESKLSVMKTVLANFQLPSHSARSATLVLDASRLSQLIRALHVVAEDPQLEGMIAKHYYDLWLEQERQGVSSPPADGDDSGSDHGKRLIKSALVTYRLA